MTCKRPTQRMTNRTGSNAAAPKRSPLTDAEREALRQSDEAFDWRTHNAIIQGTYTGPLPEYDGAYWSSIYPYLYHTKIAGINFRRGISDLAGVYFDALLVLDHHNKYDTNAIKIIHATDNRHLGFVPADKTDDVRKWVNYIFPHPCRAHIDEWTDFDEDTERDRTFLFGEINIPRPNVSPI